MKCTIFKSQESKTFGKDSCPFGQGHAAGALFWPGSAASRRCALCSQATSGPQRNSRVVDPGMFWSCVALASAATGNDNVRMPAISIENRSYPHCSIVCSKHRNMQHFSTRIFKNSGRGEICAKNMATIQIHILSRYTFRLGFI